MNGRELDRAEQLARRRERLVQRSHQLRTKLVDEMQVVQPAMLWVDRLQDTWNWLRSHPMAVASGVLAVIAWRPRRSLRLAFRLWSGWKLLQRARSAGGAVSRLF